MEGLAILDDLDSDALGIYCVMMARYESQCKLLAGASKALKSAEGDPERVEAAAGRLGEINAKMSGIEKNILAYAEKLGLTPSGRVRLAQKRAKAMAEADPDGDLYGD
jgi:P27 family predicted phage terminase small subunit